MLINAIFMDRKKIIAITVLVVVLIAAVGGGLWWYGGQSGGSKPAANIGNTNSNQQGDAADGTVTPVAPVTVTAETSATRLARLFTERFGTFSTDEGFAGIVELAPLLTDSFSSWATGTYLPQLRTTYKDGFASEITRVLSAHLVQEGDNKATVRLSIQRTIVVGSDAAKVENATVRVDLVRQGDNWLVDGFFDETK
ncbi:hypothetical protein COV04_00145 [Candidatus Uhrbacteria bacterium CG10_big_fil_rev_8_21_14_0_10_48_11]|uniref:Uncharacterized protein n=1 Tax=Candidatus Uhrbacteria bacterium CG10_big_fil_rev_8_21_14_0_10_48_11 TaxID=1975037 RepID=A0A2M8LFR8_9BACT|nr:MAG: hypothetical protein COV04_00145 [Candidatus Uhrbacteria bacterium CG10_big_fil_rev_8_21_14_0_10_48_11]